MQKKHYLTVSLLLSPMIALSVDSTSAFSESITSTRDTVADVKKDSDKDSDKDSKAGDAATGEKKEEKQEGSQSNKQNQVDSKQAEKDKKAAEKQAAKDAKQAEINANQAAQDAYVHQADALSSVLPAVSPQDLYEAAALLDAQADQKAEELVREITAISAQQPELGKEKFNQVVTQALKRVQRELTTVVDSAQRKAVLDKFIAKLYSMHNDAVKKDADNTQKTHLSTDEAKKTHAHLIAAEQTLHAAILLLSSDDQKAAMLKDYKKTLTEQSFKELVGDRPTTALVTVGLAAAGVAGAAVYLYEQGVVRATLETGKQAAEAFNVLGTYALKNGVQVAQGQVDQAAKNVLINAAQVSLEQINAINQLLN